MKKIALFLMLATTLLADSITLDNQTKYPTKQTKMAVQWADSAKEVDEANRALMDGEKINPSTLQKISGKGKVKLTVPNDAQLFRVLVWSNGAAAPDYSTNWIDITPDKTYTLDNDYLVPVVLMAGSGC